MCTTRDQTRHDMHALQGSLAHQTAVCALPNCSVSRYAALTVRDIVDGHPYPQDSQAGKERRYVVCQPLVGHLGRGPRNDGDWHVAQYA